VSLSRIVPWGGKESALIFDSFVGPGGKKGGEGGRKPTEVNSVAFPCVGMGRGGRKKARILSPSRSSFLLIREEGGGGRKRKKGRADGGETLSYFLNTRRLRGRRGGKSQGVLPSCFLGGGGGKKEGSRIAHSTLSCQGEKEKSESSPRPWPPAQREKKKDGTATVFSTGEGIGGSFFHHRATS